MYNVDKSWLTDQTNNDLSALNNSINLVDIIKNNYELLDPKYKKFVEKQINELLLIQEKEKTYLDEAD